MAEVEEYISKFPDEVQKILNALRNIVNAASPDIEEEIAYKMPAYKIHGKPLIYFAAYKNHIGVYATPEGHIEFSKELSMYKQGKGSVQFPINGTFPYELFERMLDFKLKQLSSKNKK